MDTCVLIPAEMAVVMACPADPRNIFDMTITLWANLPLRPGRIFYPDRGEVRLDKLELFSRLHYEDKRRDFGCEDDILEIEGREVRHCNWVRFLRTSNNPAEVNIVASIKHGRPAFRVTKDISTNNELIALLDAGSDITDSTESERVPSDIQTSSSSIGDNKATSLSCTPISDRSMQMSSSESRFAENETSSSMNVDNNDSKESEKPLNSSDIKEISPVRGLDVLDLSLPLARASSTPIRDSEMISAPRRNRERTWLPCDVCGKKFDRPSLLKRHIRTHTGERPHACDVCGKAFSTSSSLNTHRRIHSGERPHECGICGKRFTASSNLYYHRMTHNKEKPHKCNVCAKSFPTPGDLKSHMYIHSGEWPFTCDVCHRGFSKQTNLRNHLALHTGEKPFECNTCGKKFALSTNLKTHLKTHQESQPSECIQCGTMFQTSPEKPQKICKMCQRNESSLLDEDIQNGNRSFRNERKNLQSRHASPWMTSLQYATQRHPGTMDNEASRGLMTSTEHRSQKMPRFTAQNHETGSPMSVNGFTPMFQTTGLYPSMAANQLYHHPSHYITALAGKMPWVYGRDLGHAHC